MRFILASAAPLAIAATAPVQSAPDLMPPPDAEHRKNCRDRIELVREELGLPKLQRDNTSPNEPLLIAAVDKRISGCSVMVMRHDTNDVRPLPEIEEGSAKLMPAR